MRSVVETFRSSASLRAILIGTVSLAAAGCSSEVTRFSGPLFGGGSSTTQYTGTVKPYPSGAVEQSPLDDPSGTPSYGAPSYGTMAAAPAPAMNAGPGNADATSITVQQGDTIYSIARRYGIPHTALMQANGLSDPMAVRPGQQLVVPVYSRSTAGWQAPTNPTAPAPMMAAAPTPTTVPTTAPSQDGSRHTIRAGETVYSIARAYNVSPNEIIRANNLSSPNNIRIGQTLVLPGTQMAAAQPNAGQQAQAPVQTAQAPQQMTLPAEAPSAAPTQAQPVSYTPSINDGGGDSRAGLPEPAELAGGKFRWPVRGRIITAFGEKSDGGKNDGVNISVPEGTSIRAAENGVVAYAGDELKGYGKLVLVRHDDEWVSAYAHNSELLVKRGDTVSRGQVIAKAGQSGSVDSPQLHFELRKGSQPVDPLRHLAEN